MAQLKNIPVHDGCKFSWVKDSLGHVGLAERSDFGGTCLHARIYDDAMDVGFYVKGKRSTELFFLADAEYDNENDLVATIYECASNPRITISIVND